MKMKSLLLILWLFCGMSALAQSRKQSYDLELTSQTASPAIQETIVRDTVHVPDAKWLRLQISDFNLGKASYLILTSLQDKGQQRLNAQTLMEWGKTSAYFNGEAVEAELHVAPGETGIFISIAELLVGEAASAGNRQFTLCGGDNRVASTDARVGRINVANTAGAVSNPYCTAWLVSNGAILTAGHCVDQDPDQGGPLLPDGTTDAGFFLSVVEFNVPATQNNGSTVFANPDDQYPIDATRIRVRFDGAGQGLGKDWSVFACRRNTNTGLLPHEAQGSFFRMTNDAPAAGATVRVTGFGTDTGAENQTLQTAAGPYSGESQSNAEIWHRYAVDTNPANSGSPIIWEANGLAIGIHTNGGCTSSGGANSGTSFEHDALETALQNFPGANTVYVDNGHPTAIRNGTIFRPHSTVTTGVNVAASGGTISIVAGTYGDRLTISKPITLSAPAGAVIIGR
jgi:V8-like Glu-specific endopeptidase